MTTSYFLLSVSALIFFGCRDQVSNPVSGEFEKGKILSELRNKKLKETSGLAASVRNPSLLWAVCDSGNEPEVYLVDKDLNIRFTVALEGINNRDWEDIAVGPGPDSAKTYIYVGDIGDNEAIYPEKYIFRFEEPLDSTGVLSLKSFDKIVFRLEGNIKDTESLFIDSMTRDIYVVSKREEPVHVYALNYPQSVRETMVASEVLSLPFKQIVSADCNPRNGEILMKNYDAIYYWKNNSGLDILSLLKQTPQEIPYEREPQGESIAWAADGSGFFTISEKKKKKPSHLYFYRKK